VRKQVEQKKKKKPSLIRAYGEFWRRDWVNWESKRIFGKRSSKGKPVGDDVNIFGQFGVYVLYLNDTPKYVGQGQIGARIRGRKTKELWNEFSWYGTRALTKENLLMEGSRTLGGPTGEVVNALEALLIRTATPAFNTKRQRLTGAVRLLQSETHKPSEPDEFFLWIRKGRHPLPKTFEEAKRLTKRYLKS
jgi:hypothetical protein